MDKCGKCDRDIGQQRDMVKCSDCGAAFHISCARSVSGDSGRKISARNNYKCEACVSESSSTSSKPGQERDTAAVLDAIAQLKKSNDESFALMRKENSEMWKKTQENFNTLQENINLLNTGLGEVKKNYLAIEKSVNQNNNNIKDLQEENSQLSETVTKLQSEINDLQQYSRVDNMIITGIPLTKGEDIYSILADVAHSLGINFNRYDVSAAHRLSMQTVRGRPPAIVVKFLSRAIKADWMFARKQKQNLRANEIHRSFPDSTVFFNEHLTAHTRDIFNAGRQLVKESKLAFVWVSDGRVLAKVSPTGKTIRVTSVGDMKRLVPASGAPQHRDPADDASTPPPAQTSSLTPAPAPAAAAPPEPTATAPASSE